MGLCVFSQFCDDHVNVYFISLSHPRLGWLYVFSSFPPPRPRPRPPPPPQRLLLLTSKLFELHLRYLGQRKYKSGKMYWMTFWWPWPKVRAVRLIKTNLLVYRIKWEPLIQSLQNLVALFLIFLWKFWMCFFKVKHSIGDISGMVGQIDVERKGGASVGYRVNYVTLTFDLTYDLNLVVSRSKFEITLFEEGRGADWHGTKGMCVNHSWPWPWAMGNHARVGGCTI